MHQIIIALIPVVKPDLQINKEKRFISRPLEQYFNHSAKNDNLLLGWL